MNGEEYEIRTKVTVWDADVNEDGLNTTNIDSFWRLKLFYYEYLTPNVKPYIIKDLPVIGMFVGYPEK